MSTSRYGLGRVPDGLAPFHDSGLSVQGAGGELVSSWNGFGDVRGRAVEFDDLTSGEVGKCHGHVVRGRREDDGAWLMVGLLAGERLLDGGEELGVSTNSTAVAASRSVP